MINLRDSRRKQGFLVFLVTASAFAIYLLARGCAENEESRVRKVIYSGSFCVEKRDLSRCAPLVSENYEDKYGNSKLTFLRVVSAIFGEYQDIKVEIKQLKIDIEDTQATADVSFKAYFRKPGDVQLYYDNGKLEVRLDKGSGRWKVVSIEYSGSSEILFLQTVA